MALLVLVPSAEKLAQEANANMLVRLEAHFEDVKSEAHVVFSKLVCGHCDLQSGEDAFVAARRAVRSFVEAGMVSLVDSVFCWKALLKSSRTTLLSCTSYWCVAEYSS